MKKFIIIFLISIISLSSLPASAQNILKEMRKREETLKLQLVDQFDKKKRSESILKLEKIQEMYDDPDIRQEMVYQSNPVYFKNAKRKSFAELNVLKEENRDPSKPELYEAPEVTNADDIWSSYADEKKISYCKQAKDSCDSQLVFENCRFVFQRCQSYISKPEFDSFIERFSKKNKKQ